MNTFFNKKTIFLLSVLVLFLSFSSVFAAGELTITSNKSTLEIGDNSTVIITAASNKTNGGELVSFTSTHSTLLSTTCNMPEAPGIQKCSVSLIPDVVTNATTILVRATASIEATIFESNDILISVGGGLPTCFGNLVLDKTRSSCITPLTASDCPGRDVNTERNGCSEVLQSTCTGEDCTTLGETTYKLLAPIPGTGLDSTIETQKRSPDDCPFGNYFNILVKIVIGFSAVLAMIMIVVGGIEYMTSELVSQKQSGKETVTNAILGLIIALGAFTILNTINPNLLDACLNKLTEVKIVVADEPETGIAAEEIVLVDASGNSTSVKACDPDQITTMNLFGHRVEVNKGVVKSLEWINMVWEAQGSAQYKVYSIGGYNCRMVAGTDKWSAHAFGLALDINPETNPFGKNAGTDMPEHFWKLFKQQGWGWGGEWTRVKDAMHFSKYPPSEGGNGVLEL